jgi:hypothetical protein
MMDYIITAKHYCKREGVSSVKERILKLHRELQKKRGFPIAIKIDEMSQQPVYARIELGQWIADCECGGAEFVDCDEPVFYCFSCANRDEAGKLRPVVFPAPAERMEIERLILERPVDDRRGLDDLERAHMAKAMIYTDTETGSLPLTRSWNHGEPLSNLRKENEVIKKWKKKTGK